MLRNNAGGDPDDTAGVYASWSHLLNLQLEVIPQRNILSQDRACPDFVRLAELRRSYKKGGQPNITRARFRGYNSNADFRAIFEVDDFNSLATLLEASPKTLFRVVLGNIFSTTGI